MNEESVVNKKSVMNLRAEMTRARASKEYHVSRIDQPILGFLPNQPGEFFRALPECENVATAYRTFGNRRHRFVNTFKR